MPRRPPHFKIFTTVRSDSKLRGLWGSDSLLAMYVRAGILCVERFADRTQDSCLVNRHDLMDVAATQPMANAIKKLRSLVAATPLRLRCECLNTGRDVTDPAAKALGGRCDPAAIPLGPRCDCAGIWLDFPNFAKWQGFKHENGEETGGKRGSSASASSSSSSDLKTDPQKKDSAPPAAGSAAPRGPKVLKPEPPEAVQFAEDFADGLRAVHEGFKPPSEAALRSWARAARLMLTEDSRPLEEARNLARWLFEDPGAEATFWRPNVMSLPTFRKQYDRLQAQRRRSEHGPVQAIRPGPIAQAMRNIIARAEGRR
jgi:hypothetical protein